MARKREDGYCQVSTNTNGQWYLQRSQYAPVRHAWLHGVAFVDTVGFHGDRLTIRLRDVDSVNDIPAEVEQAALDERRADLADDSMQGA